MTFHKLGIVIVLLGCSALPAHAQDVALKFQDGRVTLCAKNVPLSTILSEWARVGRTTIVNGDRLVAAPVTLELDDVPEGQALDVLLRGAHGYMVAARRTTAPAESAFDRILILPTSHAPTTEPVIPSDAPSIIPQTAPDPEPDEIVTIPREGDPGRRDD